jgi:hypothetical protein
LAVDARDYFDRLGMNQSETAMKRPRLGANFTVFLLFFGVATLEAFQTQNWLKAIFWLAIGVGFLVADNLRKAQLPD